MNSLSQPNAPVLPNTARLMPTTKRQHMALQAIAGQPSTTLADQHNVSRKFVYQQLHHAHHAIDQAFDPTPRSC